ncbi:MAG: TerB family tellurite resistance protein [Alphaproteobacteria bacterium]|nr:TerB family tellurite resistance protein [Alphaproteobacteria bacterium]
MHYIEELSIEQRIAFLSAVSHVAHADDDEELHEAEENYLAVTATVYDIPKERINEIMTPKSREEIISMVKKITNPDIHLTLIREMFTVAHADGDLSDNEILAIGSIASKLGISLDKVEKISSWVLRGLEWHEEGERLFSK